MTIFENKLQDMYNRLSFLLLRFKKICANQLKDIPTQISKIIFGQNKFKIYLDNSVEYEINEDDLSYKTSIDSYLFYECTKLTNITIPDRITNIGIGAFRGCTGLTNIVIPSSIVKIETQSFYLCDNLTDMYLYPDIPPTLGGTTAIIPTTTTIHVPIGSGDAYKNATNWSSFADKIVEDIEI